MERRVCQRSEEKRKKEKKKKKKKKEEGGEMNKYTFEKKEMRQIKVEVLCSDIIVHNGSRDEEEREAEWKM